jgi:hypothetical protein
MTDLLRAMRVHRASIVQVLHGGFRREPSRSQPDGLIDTIRQNVETDRRQIVRAFRFGNRNLGRGLHTCFVVLSQAEV